MLRSPKTNQRAERRLAFHVDGTGTASIVKGSGLATLTDTDTGDYLLTFTRPFTRAPIGLLSVITAAKTGRLVLTTTTAQILTFNQADGTTASDADFYVEIIGWDIAEEYSERD